jgi:hypothetical protein
MIQLAVQMECVGVGWKGDSFPWQNRRGRHQKQGHGTLSYSTALTEHNISFGMSTELSKCAAAMGQVLPLAAV